MRLLHPEFLLILIGLIPLCFLYSKKGRVPALRFSTTTIVQQFASKQYSSPGNITVLLRVLSLSLLIFCLARPQYGSSNTEISASGIDILLAVDISGSMEAMDFTLDNKPVSRLSAVKKVVRDFINDRPNDRIALLAFSGQPYLVSPLTLDHDWLLKRLDALRIGMIKEEGTAIGSAISSGLHRLHSQKSKSKILILS